jgi:hypothetical protein
LAIFRSVSVLLKVRFRFSLPRSWAVIAVASGARGSSALADRFPQCGQQVWLGPALAGRTVTIWADEAGLHGWLRKFTGTFTAASFVMGAIMAIGGIATLMLTRVKPNAQLVPSWQERSACVSCV